MFNTWQLPIRSDHLTQVTEHHVDLGRWNSPWPEESVGWKMDIEWTCEMLLDVFETVEDWRINMNQQQMVGACVGTRMPKLFTVLSDPPKQTTWRILIRRDMFNPWLNLPFFSWNYLIMIVLTDLYAALQSPLCLQEILMLYKLNPRYVCFDRDFLKRSLSSNFRTSPTTWKLHDLIITWTLSDQ